MKNLKLTISYDGSRYYGWERQPGRDTIQGKLEAVLSRMVNAEVNVIGAGRTDAGVHARKTSARRKRRPCATRSRSVITSRPSAASPIASPEQPQNYYAVPVADEDVFTACLSSYRASGTGGYDCYSGCPVLREIGTEMSDLRAGAVSGAAASGSSVCILPYRFP